MRRWSFNEDEYRALLDADPFDVKLYLFGLRRHMDYGTGRVGEARRISYQSLSEEVDSFPEVRSRTERVKPSQKALRCALERLERFGLVEKINRTRDSALLFFLPLADTGEIRPDFEGHMRGMDEGHVQSESWSGFAANEGHGQNVFEGHTSGDASSLRSNRQQRIETVATARANRADGQQEGEGRPWPPRLDDLPAVPEQAAQWVVFFQRVGFPLHAIKTATVVPMLAEWCKRRIPLAVAMQAVEIGNARASPVSPAYYQRIVQDVLSGKARANNAASGRNGRSGAGTAGGYGSDARAGRERVRRDTWAGCYDDGGADDGGHVYEGTATRAG